MNALLNKTKLHKWYFKYANKLRWTSGLMSQYWTRQKVTNKHKIINIYDNEACIHEGNCSKLQVWLNNNAPTAMVMGKTSATCKLLSKHKWINIFYVNFMQKNQFCWWWFYSIRTLFQCASWCVHTTKVSDKMLLIISYL